MARKRLPARTSALSGLPPRFKAALVRVLTPLSAGFRGELRETQAGSSRRLGLREKDDWQAGGRTLGKGEGVAGARGRGQCAHAQPPCWGGGRSCAGRSGDAVLAEEPLVVLVGFPDAAGFERSRSSGLHFPLDFASSSIWIYSLFSETVTPTVTHAGLELAAILLPLPTNCCDYRCDTSRLAIRLFINVFGLFIALLDVCN